MRTFSYCSTPASRLGKSLSTGSHRKPRVSALGLGELKVDRSLTILWSGGGIHRLGQLTAAAGGGIPEEAAFDTVTH